MEVMFLLLQQRKAHELDMITPLKSCIVVIHDMITQDLNCLDMIKLYNLHLDDVTGTDFENSLSTFGQSEKRY